MRKESCRRGSHTVTDLKYHFVWKTKYNYDVLRGELGLRLRDILGEICAETGMEVVKGNVQKSDSLRF